MSIARAVLHYFRRPFPSRQGFSAYRMPGLSVHIPLIFTFTMSGVLLLSGRPAATPFIFIWFLAGIYLGRDITILAHYNPLLMFASWGYAAFILIKPQTIQHIGEQHRAVAIVGTVFLALAQLLVAVLAGSSALRAEEPASKPSDSPAPPADSSKSS